jgi:hypothetical protein
MEHGKFSSRGAPQCAQQHACIYEPRGMSDAAVSFAVDGDGEGYGTLATMEHGNFSSRGAHQCAQHACVVGAAACFAVDGHGDGYGTYREKTRPG